MIGKVLSLFDSSKREVARLSRTVEQINALEPHFLGMPDEAIRARIEELRAQVQAGEMSLDEILVEVFAAVREASRRTTGLRQFDVQLIGGMVLHQGKIAEMKTGEGKTLVATLPLVLNALEGRGCHLVTQNDYLAKRDAQWMGPIYDFLGLTVGVIQHDMEHEEHKAAYGCDITYGTNNEFGFDYLRDNMVVSKDHLVQRELHYAIVDEVDNLLVDEARTPLIISGVKAASSDLYHTLDRVVRGLQPEDDYTVEEKHRQAALTEEGVTRVERTMGIENLSDPEHVEIYHHIMAALRAHAVYKRDVDYVVREGEVIIVDEFTGRLMFGRRYSEGLHQALEAKENVRVEHESQTLATITFQNFFRLYRKLAGMTGTAKTEETEFIKIYGVPVVCIPTHMSMIRADFSDVVYKTEEAKFRGIVYEILSKHVVGQPALVGTRSIQVSERLSRRLEPNELQHLVIVTVLMDGLDQHRDGLAGEKRSAYEKALFAPLDQLRTSDVREIARLVGMPPDPLHEDTIRRFAQLLGLEGYVQRLTEVLTDGIPHNVLNAKHHEREAQIIAEAGRVCGVTIATNMAGRGVDIHLGGAPPEGMLESPAHGEITALGGLHVVGTERHESRRIDNQLRGRSGRQGDPGSSRFFVCLEDELWRLFGAQERFQGLQRGWRENEPIENRLLSRMIEHAQQKVEANHYEMRKYVLKYDDVMNTQRAVIYGERRKLLEGGDFRETVIEMFRDVVAAHLNHYASELAHPEEWDLEGLIQSFRTVFPFDSQVSPEQLRGLERDDMHEAFFQAVLQAYEAREAELGAETAREIERLCLLRVIDERWIDHLDAMDYLREHIHLRGHAQIDPLVAYHKEAYEMFQELLMALKQDAIRYLFRIRIAEGPRGSLYRPQQEGRGSVPMPGSPEAAGGSDGNGQLPEKPRPIRVEKVGRNDPCPCGSGKKYKKCCLVRTA